MQASNDVMGGRARWAIMACWAMMITSGLLLLFELAESFGAINSSALEEGVYQAYMAIIVLQVLCFLLSVIFVAMWIHRAHANLANAGMEGLEFTPGWAVGWYFIPLFNLVKPYQAMRELWNRTMGHDYAYTQETPAEVKVWWGTWILGSVLGNISSRMTSVDDIEVTRIGASIGAASSIVFLICAWILLGLIKQISAQQEKGLNIADVFA